MKKKWFIALTPLLLPAIFWADTPLIVKEEGDEGLFFSLTRKGESSASLPSQRTVVTKEEIERSGARNLGEALNLVPGAVFNRTGTLGAKTSLRLRGTPSSNQVQVLIDDQPVGGIAVQGVDLSQIPVNDIERIEIVRGGSSVLFGANAIGGLVNVITRKHREDIPVTNIGMSYGSFNSQMYQGDFGVATESLEGFVSAARTLTDGFQENSDYDGINVSGRGAYSFGEGNNVSLNISRVDTEVGTPVATPVPLGEWDGKKEQEALDTTSRVDQKHTRARLKADLLLGGWAVLKPMIFLGQTAYQYSSLTYPSDHQDKVNGTDVHLQTIYGTVLGGSYERDEHEASGESAVHVTNWGLYAQQDIQWGSLKIDPAIRMDQHSTYGNTYNPRVGLVWKALKDLKVSATAARSFRAPTFLDLYYPGSSNPNLNPETAWSYDTGLELSGRNGNGFRLTGFYTKIEDRIVFASIPINEPTAELSGVELELFNRYKMLTSRISYAYTRAIGTSQGSSKNETLSRTPRHTAAQELLLALPNKWTVRNGLRYVDDQYEKNGENGLKLPSFTLWDMGITKKVLSMEVTFAVDNITDKHYAESIGYDNVVYAAHHIPQPGRTYRFGVTMRFLN
jgi:vitamin B12 transporter